MADLKVRQLDERVAPLRPFVEDNHGKHAGALFAMR